MRRIRNSWPLLLLAIQAVAMAQQPGEPQPTLPPVVVEAPGDDGEGFVDGIDSSLLGGALGYPSLGDQTYDGLDSVTRGQGSLFDFPSAGNIVDRQMIEEKDAQDMARALQFEVGILVQQTARGQASPFIRGLTGQQVLILVDGVRLNNSTFRAGPNQYFNLVDPGQVQRIEVLRGPQSVLWGADALGGVINIVTRSADINRGNYTQGSITEYFSTADTASYTRGNAEGWSGSGGVFAGGSYLAVNNLDRGGDLGRQPFTNYDQYAGDVKYDLLVNPDQTLTVALQHFEQQNVPRSDRFEPFVLGPPANTARPTFFDPQQRDLVYLRWQGLGCNALFDAFSSTASYSRLKEGMREIRNPLNDIRISEIDVNTFGYTVNFSKELNDFSRLVYGGDFYYDDIDSFRNRRDPSASTVTPIAPPLPNDAVYDRTGIYASLSVDVTDRLNVIAGGRYETIHTSGSVDANSVLTPFDKTYQDWLGNVGFVYELYSDLNLVGGVYEGFRAPNLDDLASEATVLQSAADIPSLDVLPEHSLNYELGFRHDGERFRFQLVEFWTNINDNILRQAVDNNGVPVPNTVNADGLPVPGSSNFIRSNFDTYLNGTELSGEYLLDCGWALYGNCWAIWGQDLDRNEPLTRVPPVQGVLGLRWNDAPRRRYFDVFTWLVAEQDRYAAQNNIDSRFPIGATPGYATLNVRMGTALGEDLNHQVSLVLENITDEPYRVLGSGVDGAGFNAILGYTYTR